VLGNVYRVVVIEDNPGDVFLLREALAREAKCEVTVITDGDRAFEYFQSRFFGTAAPDLVVLDLNLPGRDGVEVLRLVRTTPELSHIPVAVVSSSPKDVLSKQAGQADACITKPSDIDAYLALGKELLQVAKR
jgi:CheY-like chemotaxis protein